MDEEKRGEEKIIPEEPANDEGAGDEKSDAVPAE